MKKYKLKYCLIISLSLVTTVVFAQDAALSAGGEASGSSGNVSYSVGQVLFTTDVGADGSVVKGVQQVYEISEITGIDQLKDISLHSKVYPNPVSDYLTLSINDLPAQALEYKLYRFDGLLIETGRISTLETEIQVHDLIQGAYFLRILDNENVVKAFKIIKH